MWLDVGPRGDIDRVYRVVVKSLRALVIMELLLSAGVVESISFFTAVRGVVIICRLVGVVKGCSVFGEMNRGQG